MEKILIPLVLALAFLTSCGQTQKDATADSEWFFPYKIPAEKPDGNLSYAS